MTLDDLARLNSLRDENRRLKEENERLRTRNCALLYCHEQAATALQLTKVLVGARA